MFSLKRINSILTVIVIVAVIFAAGYFFGPSGTATGVEFSPDRFCHRSFRYTTWCGLQLWPQETHEWRSKVDDYVHAAGFATPSVRTTPRWHFIKGFAPGVHGWSGPAKFMCQAIGC